MLAFTLGILLVFTLRSLPSPGSLALLVLPLCVPWRGRVLLAAFVLGVVLCSWHGQRYLDQRWPAAKHGETEWMQGTIVSLPERQLGAGGAVSNWRFEFAPKSADLPQRIRVSWYRSEGDSCGRTVLALAAASAHAAWVLQSGRLRLRGMAVARTHRCDRERC
ncbi:MAG: DUF4131 domain-containing protein [Pseudomonadota bacterium]|nr:DUF4131 domain-containing protein [Pseudomonadota bacterium]